MIGLVLGVLEVGVWNRTSILENITWHRHAEGDMVVLMEVLVVDGLDLMLKCMLKTGEKPD